MPEYTQDPYGDHLERAQKIGRSESDNLYCHCRRAIGRRLPARDLRQGRLFYRQHRSPASHCQRARPPGIIRNSENDATSVTLANRHRCMRRVGTYTLIILAECVHPAVN